MLTVYFVFLCIFIINVSIKKPLDRNRDQDQKKTGSGPIIGTRIGQDRDWDWS